MIEQTAADVVLMADPRVAEMPVREIDEGPVDVRDVLELALDPLKETPSGAYALLRRGVSERLLAAQDQLPAGYRLLLVEGYRPYDLQEQYFSSYRSRVEELDPSLDSEASFLLASRYVSPPQVAPHVSGAAIDLTLTDESGRHADLGTPINAPPEDSAAACYFAADNISKEARHHRDLLATALSGAGLVNYPTEWWHWSYGDRYWALMTRHPNAPYGPVRLPD